MSPTVRAVVMAIAMVAGMLAAVSAIGPSRPASAAPRAGGRRPIEPVAGEAMSTSWDVPATVPVGGRVTADLFVASTVSLHDVTLRLAASGGVESVRTDRIPTTVGTAHSEMTVSFAEGHPGLGEVQATISGSDASGRRVTATAALWVSTVGRLAALSSLGRRDADELALAMEQTALGRLAYHHDLQTLETGGGGQVASVEHVLEAQRGDPPDMTTVTGRVMYQDVAGHAHPARTIDVEIDDISDSFDGVDAVTCTQTDTNGYFSAAVTTYRTTGQPRSLAYTAFAESVLPSPTPANPCAFESVNGIGAIGAFEGFKVVNPANGATYSMSTINHPVAAAAGTIPLPDLTASNNTDPSFDNQTAFALGDAMVTGDQFLIQYNTSTHAPYSLLSIQYPATGTENFSQPATINVIQGEEFFWDPLLHEFGHYVAYDLSMLAPVGPTHYFGENNSTVCVETGLPPPDPPSSDPCTLEGKPAGIQAAWNEGFADWFSIMVQQAEGVAAMNIPHAGDDTYYDSGPTSSIDVSLDATNANPDATGLKGHGEDDELSVARSLWQIQQDPLIGMNGFRMLDALAAKPPLTFSAALPDLITSAGADSMSVTSAPADASLEEPVTNEFACVLSGEAIAPRLLDAPGLTDADPNVPTTYYWRLAGAGGEYPLNHDIVQFWSSDWSTLVFQSGLLIDRDSYSPTPKEWDTILAATDSAGNPITGFNVTVVGSSTSNPATGPYRSCNATLDHSPPNAAFLTNEPGGGDLTGQSVAMSSHGTTAVVGSPATCAGYIGPFIDNSTCDPSQISFWSFDPDAEVWSKGATFTEQQIGIPRCSMTSCDVGVVVGGAVAISGDGLTAATTVEVNENADPQDAGGPWDLEIATFANENGTWVNTGEPGGVLDTVPDTSGIYFHVPISAVALDYTGDEMLVSDPYSNNPLSGESTSENEISSQGTVDVFASAGSGAPSGFSPDGSIEDPTQDPYPDDATCSDPDEDCTIWQELFGVSIALSEDGNTAVISDGSSYYSRTGADDSNGDADVFRATQSGTARSWSGQSTVITGADIPTTCDTICFDDFGDSFYSGESVAGTGLAVSSDGRTVVAGDPGHNGGTGSAYVFTANPAGGYNQAAELTSSDAVTESLGSSVAVSSNGSEALVGAPDSAVNSVNEAGEAELFAAGPAETANPSGWVDANQSADLHEPQIGSNDVYGTSVAISGDGTQQLVGAPNNLESPGAPPGAAYFTQEAQPTGIIVGANDLPETPDGAAEGTTGQSVTLTANVDPAPASGAVTFTGPGGMLPGCSSVPVDTAGLATCAITLPNQPTVDPTTLSDSPLAYTAGFSGGGTFLDSISDPFDLSVVSALSITTSSLPSVRAGVQLSGVQLQSTGGEGTVSWTLSGSGPDPLPSGIQLNSDGTVTGSSLVPGTYTFTALALDQSPVIQMDNQAITLTVTPNAGAALRVTLEPISVAVYGAGAGVTAVVSVTGSTQGPPAGDKVLITANGNGATAGTCTASLTGGTTDAASCSLPSTLAIGTYQVTATYEGASSKGGDPSYPSYTSAPGVLTVEPVPTVTTIGALLPMVSGQATDVAVTVASTGNFAAQPTGGTVQVEADLQGGATDVAMCTATLTGTILATGTCDLGSDLEVGTYELIANFPGNPEFLPSEASGTLTVVEATTTTVSVPAPETDYGNSVQYDVTVATGDGSAPIGTVSVTSGTTSLCSTSSFRAAEATCSSTEAPAGDDPITATFTSGVGFASSSSTTSLDVLIVAPPAPPASTASNREASQTNSPVSAAVPGISASGNGPGALTVATYSGINPTGTAVGGGTGPFYDVAVGNGSDFDPLTIVVCNLGTGGNALSWWNGTVWQPFSDQTVDTTGPNAGCVTGIVYPAASYDQTSPTLQELIGTPIAVVNLATGDFTVKVSPSNQSLGELSSVGYTVAVGSTGGFGEPVALSVSGLPAGVTGTFDPISVTSNGTSILTLSSGATLSSSGGAFTVTGTYGTISHSDTSASVSLNFELQPTCYGSITGTVTDAQTDRPVIGATLLLDGFNVATTDQNGEYSASQISLGPNNGTTTVTLETVASGYFNHLSSPIVVACGPTATYDPSLTEMQYGGVIGHVYVGIANPVNPAYDPPIATATALAGANLSLSEYEANTGGALGASTPSGSDGSYSFTQVPLGSDNTPIHDQLTATGPSTNPSAYPNGFWPSTEDPLISAGSTTPQDIALVPVCTGYLAATVYSEDTGLPISGATVSDGVGAMVTDGSGVAEFSSVELGTDNSPRLYAFTAENAQATGSSVGVVETTLAGCGDTESVSLYIHVPVNNYGSAVIDMVDAVTGQPVSGATLFDCENSVGGFTQNPTGTFDIPQIFVGTDSETTAPCSLSADAPGYYGNGTTLTIDSGLTTTATLALLPELSSTIQGTVTDAVTGQPIKGITVSGGNGATTDADGFYSLSGNILLGANNASQPDTIDFSSPTATYLYASGSVTAVAGQTETLNIKMVPQCGPATVTGTVYDAANQQPILGAEVQEGRNGEYDLTNQSGQFLLQVPVYDNAAFSDPFTASATGFNPKTEILELFCGAHVTLNFGQNSDETGNLTGTVTDAATGLPVSGAFVGAGFGASTTTNAQGVYSFSGVPLGNGNSAETWDVTVDPPAGSPLQPQIKSVSVPSDSTTVLNFALDSTPPPLPKAVGYQATTPEGVELSVPAASGVLSNDTGTGIVVTGYEAVTSNFGQVGISPDGSYTYVPYRSFIGDDSFTYTITDEYGHNATGTVNVDVTSHSTPTTTTSTTTIAPTTTTSTSTTSTTSPTSTTTMPSTTTTSTTTIPPTTTTTSTTVPPTTTTTSTTTTTTIPPMTTTTSTTVSPTTTTTSTTSTTTSTTSTTTIPPKTTTTTAPKTTTIPSTTSTSEPGPVLKSSSGTSTTSTPATTQGSGATQGSGSGSSLAFTGFDTWSWAWAGIASISAGVLLADSSRRRRRRSGRPDSD